MKEKSPKYRLVPMDEITPEAKRIAILWVENYKPMGYDLPGKHKLASDIMNYAENHCADLEKENKALKEKEIRGDRMIVDLEHQKAVLQAEVKKLQERVEWQETQLADLRASRKDNAPF